MALYVTPALSGAGTGGLLGLADPSLALGSVRVLSPRNEAESGRAGHPFLGTTSRPYWHTSFLVMTGGVYVYIIILVIFVLITVSCLLPN